MEKIGRNGRKRPPTKTSFKPGNPGGPGRPKIPFDQKESMRRIQEMRGLANEDFQTYMERHRHRPAHELKKIAETDSTLSVLELMVVRALFKACQSATVKEITAIKALAGGVEIKQVELTGRDGAPLNPLANKSPEELVAAWDELQLQKREREALASPVVTVEQ